MNLFSPTNNSNPFAAAKSAATANATSSTAPSSPSANSATSTATITANDFLQLLVTELQNQDPTANVDPNEYVDQLVQVNSLQQEIQMNQTLDGGPTLTGASSGVLQELTQMNNTLSGAMAPPTSSTAGAAPAAAAHRTVKSRTNVTPRNLAPAGGGNAVSNPATRASAETIANALTANPHQAGAGAHVPPGQMGAFAEFAARLRANSASGSRP